MRRIAIVLLGVVSSVGCREIDPAEVSGRSVSPESATYGGVIADAGTCSDDSTAAEVLGPLAVIDPVGNWICDKEDPGCTADPQTITHLPPLQRRAGAGPQDVTPSQFFTGIQAGDDIGTDDRWTLQHYYNWARSSTNTGADWSMRSYFNGTNAAALNPPPAIAVRTGFSTTRANDIVDVRNLSNWANDPNANNAWWTNANQANIRAYVDATATVIVNEAVADRTIYVHSGGGALLGAALRRLSMKGACDPVWNQLNNKTIRVVGLEMVFSEEVLAILVRAFAGKQRTLTLDVQNILARDAETWHGLICCEIVGGNQTPLGTAVIDDNAVLNGTRQYTFTLIVQRTVNLSPHAGIASYVLANPAVPATTEATRDDRACITGGTYTYGPGDPPPDEVPCDVGLMIGDACDPVSGQMGTGGHCEISMQTEDLIVCTPDIH